VGKSNVLAGLRDCLSFAFGTQPSQADYYLKNTRLELTLGMKCQFDESDFDVMERSISVKTEVSRSAIRSALRLLFPNCDVYTTHSSRGRTVQWTFGTRQARNRALVPDPSLGTPTSVLSFDAFVGKIKSAPDAESVDALLTKVGADPAKTSIEFDQDVGGLVGGAISNRIAVFDEVRLRPRGMGQTTLQSYDGSRVADVLHALKNGSREQRATYARIQQVFKRTFSSLKLEVTGQTQSPQIIVEQAATRLEIDLDRSGAGIGQVVTLLAHMVNTHGMVFAVDTPESNLHPHGLRTLLAFFDQIASTNQIILATHSPLVVSPHRLDSVVAIRQARGKSLVHQVSPEMFTGAEKAKLRHLLGPEARELLFSRKVIFVEGDTEIGALPILFESIHRDLDKEGVSLVPVDGKHFAKFVKIAKAFGIPFSVLCDRDALANVETSVSGPDGRIRCSVVLSQLHELQEVSYRWIKSTWISARSAVERARPPVYPPELVSRFLSVASRHRVFVWPSDLEGVLESVLSKSIVREVKSETRSKVVRGRSLASAVVENRVLPPDIERVLFRIIRMRTRVE